MTKIIIYIGNLPLEFTEEELRQKFSRFGDVSSVTIMNDRYIGSGQRKGYGYVEMVERSKGEIAIERLKGEKFGGSVIEIMEALPLSEKKGAVALKVISSKWTKQKRRQRE
jgi:RNA recognition motif-containing protein